MGRDFSHLSRPTLGFQGIHKSSTEPCTVCGNRDNLMHRLIESGEGSATWNQTRSLIARIMRTAPARIPSEWLIRPQFHLWPAQRQRAVLWIIARYINCRKLHPCTTTKQDLMDYMRRSRWKTYRRPNRAKLVANFLKILDPP